MISAAVWKLQFCEYFFPIKSVWEIYWERRLINDFVNYLVLGYKFLSLWKKVTKYFEVLPKRVMTFNACFGQ